MESPPRLTSPSTSKRSAFHHFHNISFFQKLHHKQQQPLPPSNATPEDPLKIDVEKSKVVVIKPKSHKPTLLYRLFHSDEESHHSDDQHHHDSSSQHPNSLNHPTCTTSLKPKTNHRSSFRNKSSNHFSDHHVAIEEEEGEHQQPALPKFNLFISDSEESECASSPGAYLSSSSFLNRKSKSVKDTISSPPPPPSSSCSSSSSLKNSKHNNNNNNNNNRHGMDSVDLYSGANPSKLASQTRQKSHSNLIDFFKNHEQRKELPYLFKHLKPHKNSSSSHQASLQNNHLQSGKKSGLVGHDNTTYRMPQNKFIPNVDISSSTLIVPKSASPSRNASECSLSEKYGWIEKGCVGKGANGIVRVSHKQDPNCPNNEKLYAIKEFRRRNKNESEKSYIKKLTSEFCIGSSLHHENVIETVDLIQNEQQQWCEVMEYCAGGDLCNLIQNKHLSADEANIYFIQLIHGVAYIHSMGVAHRDLKPENLMLDAKGCLKITDFGEAEVFQSPYERSPHKSKRCCGSQPYMAPEEFIEEEFDPRPIDIFACGIIYLAMIYNRLPWKKPHIDDPGYKFYTLHRISGFSMIERLPQGPRQLIKKILDPDPNLRPSMNDIQSDPWFKQTELFIEIEKKIKENHGTLRSQIDHPHEMNCNPLTLLSSSKPSSPFSHPPSNHHTPSTTTLAEACS